MKKIYTLIAAALLICCATTLTFAQAKKVLYITLDKAMDATASTPANDPILKMLQADPNLNVTPRLLTSAEATSTATAIDLAPYDVIVIQESLSGGSQILFPGSALGLANLTKPTVYNKSYALAAGRAFTTGTLGGGVEASTVEAPALGITVPADKRNHPLYKGITFGTNGEVNLFVTGSQDNGAPATGTQVPKGLNFSNNTVLANAGTPLATNATLLANTNLLGTTGTPVFFNDIPAGTTIGSETTKARIITLGQNFGAINKDNGTNITAANLAIWKNAVYTLAGLVTSTKSELANAFFSLGQNYPNPANGATTITFELKKGGQIALEVFDVTGRKVATLAEGSKAAGAYEVKMETPLKSGVYFYRLSTEGATASRTMLVTR